MPRSVTCCASLAAMLAVALAGCGGGKGDATGKRSEPGATGSVRSSAPTAPQSGDPGAAVASTLMRYVTAYNVRDLGVLQGTLAPTVQRRQPLGGGCVVSRGLAPVLTAISGELRLRAGSYTGGSPAPSSVRVHGDSAFAALRYQPRQGRSFDVAVRERREAEGWRIDRVTAPCHLSRVAAATRPEGPAAGGGTPASARRSQVVHPRKGCTVILAPQHPRRIRRYPPPVGTPPSERRIEPIPQPPPRVSPRQLLALCAHEKR